MAARQLRQESATAASSGMASARTTQATVVQSGYDGVQFEDVLLPTEVMVQASSRRLHSGLSNSAAGSMGMSSTEDAAFGGGQHLAANEQLAGGFRRQNFIFGSGQREAALNGDSVGASSITRHGGPKSCGVAGMGNGQSSEGEREGWASSSWTSGNSGNTEVPASEHTGPGSNQEASVSDGSAGGSGSGGATHGSGGDFIGQLPQQQHQRQQKMPTRRSRASNSMGDTGLADKVTTLLVTNIPTYLTQGALLSMFEDLHPAMRGRFDLFFCPWDEHAGQNLGYAIFNFLDAEDASAFQQAWSNKELCRGGRGQKSLRVVKAALQGSEANIEYFSKVRITECSDPRFRPLVRDVAGMLRPLALDTSHEPPGTRDAPQQAQHFSRDQPGQQPFVQAHMHPRQQQQRRQQHQQQQQQQQQQQRAPQHNFMQMGIWKGDVDGGQMASGAAGMGAAELQVQAQPQVQYWSSASAPDGAEVMSWPVMMAAVPWPMTDQTVHQQTALTSEQSAGEQGDGSQAAGADAAAGGSHPGPQLAGGVGGASQVPYQQLVPYMVMPVEQMMPAEGFGGRGPFQAVDTSGMPTGNAWSGDSSMIVQESLENRGRWPAEREIYSD